MKQAFINVTIPVYNEERILRDTIAKVATFLSTECEYPHEIVIADNASTDKTFEIGTQLAANYQTVRIVHLEEKGRGRALKKVWMESDADIVSYMDCDLSTDLAAFPPLIQSLAGGQFDVAVGSRLLKPQLTTRGMKREVISRCYNLLVKVFFRTRFSDAQCGFKAVTKSTAGNLLPLIEDNGWFMDTELLVLAEKLDYRIFDLPVRWVDDPDSRVDLWKTAVADVRGLLRVRKKLISGGYRRSHHTKSAIVDQSSAGPVPKSVHSMSFK